MNKCIWAMFACLVCVTAQADVAPGGAIWYSNDSEGNQIQKISAAAWWNQWSPSVKSQANQDLGIQITDLRYNNPLRTHTGSSVGAVWDHRSDRLWLMGQVNLATLESTHTNHDYVSADVSALWFVHKHNLIWNAGVFSDIVDSPQGLLRGITTTGYYVGAEHYQDHWGVRTLIRNQHFSDNNTRFSWLVALDIPIAWGFRAYVNQESWYYDQNSDAYFSPHTWGRTNWGLGYRERWNKHLVLFGHVDQGRISVAGLREQVYSWRLGFTTDNTGRINAQCMMGNDINAFNYTYRYASCSIRVAQ